MISSTTQKPKTDGVQMRRVSLALVGQPGSGKTALLAALFSRVPTEVPDNLTSEDKSRINQTRPYLEPFLRDLRDGKHIPNTETAREPCQIEKRKLLIYTKSKGRESFLIDAFDPAGEMTRLLPSSVEGEANILPGDSLEHEVFHKKIVGADVVVMCLPAHEIERAGGLTKWLDDTKHVLDDNLPRLLKNRVRQQKVHVIALLTHADVVKKESLDQFKNEVSRVMNAKEFGTESLTVLPFSIYPDGQAKGFKESPALETFVDRLAQQARRRKAVPLWLLIVGGMFLIAVLVLSIYFGHKGTGSQGPKPIATSPGSDTAKPFSVSNEQYVAVFMEYLSKGSSTVTLYKNLREKSEDANVKEFCDQMLEFAPKDDANKAESIKVILREFRIDVRSLTALTKLCNGEIDFFLTVNGKRVPKAGSLASLQVDKTGEYQVLKNSQEFQVSWILGQPIEIKFWDDDPWTKGPWGADDLLGTVTTQCADFEASSLFLPGLEIYIFRHLGEEARQGNRQQCENVGDLVTFKADFVVPDLPTIPESLRRAYSAYRQAISPAPEGGR